MMFILLHLLAGCIAFSIDKKWGGEEFSKKMKDDTFHNASMVIHMILGFVALFHATIVYLNRKNQI